MGRTYLTRTSKRELEITFPILGADWQRGAVDSPQWSTIAKTAENDQEQVGSAKWGNVLGWWNAADGTQTPRSVDVTRWRFAAAIFVADEVNDYHHARSALSEEMESWWHLFSSWLEVFTRQDLAELNKPRQGIKAGEIWMWERPESGLRLRASRVTTYGFKSKGNVEPADHRTIAACMRLCSLFVRPPDEWLFIRDARALVKDEQYRRAVIDAGTAAELAMTTLLDRKLGNADEALKKALYDKYQTLNGRSQLLKKLGAGTVPERLQQELSEPRNDAAHGGTSPTRGEADLAIAKALELVEQAYPLEKFLAVAQA